MFNYFSNYRFQANVHNAKCKQVDDNIRREIYKFETKPLKSNEDVVEVLVKINQTLPGLTKPHLNNMGIFSPYTFCFVFTFLHLRGIRKLKLNLNEMSLPLTFVTNNMKYAFIASLFVSAFYGKNFKNYVDSKMTMIDARELTKKFYERYWLF